MDTLGWPAGPPPRLRKSTISRGCSTISGGFGAAGPGRFGRFRRPGPEFEIGGWGSEFLYGSPLTGKSCSVFVSCVTCVRSCARVLPGSWPLIRARVLLSSSPPLLASPWPRGPAVSRLVSRWCPGGVPVVSRWCPSGVRVVSQWCPGSQPGLSRWCPEEGSKSKHYSNQNRSIGSL